MDLICDGLSGILERISLLLDLLKSKKLTPESTYENIKKLDFVKGLNLLENIRLDGVKKYDQWLFTLEGTMKKNSTMTRVGVKSCLDMKNGNSSNIYLEACNN